MKKQLWCMVCSFTRYFRELSVESKNKDRVIVKMECERCFHTVTCLMDRKEYDMLVKASKN